MKKIRQFKEKLKNNIVLRILRVIVYVIVALLLLVIIVQKFSNNSISVGGFRIFTVVSGSMVPEYNIGDILLSKKTEAENIEIGDNVTYLGKTASLKDIIITHKVIKKDNRNGDYYFVTKGVANAIADPEISYDQIYGKVVYKTAILSIFGKLMNNRFVYFFTFMIIALIVSIEIISSVFSAGDEDDGRK
ncbi:MAG: signal peptidase I [Bacilli bacterium]|nr:signal peptidase I [Bacilli bacterium]